MTENIKELVSYLNSEVGKGGVRLLEIASIEVLSNSTLIKGLKIKYYAEKEIAIPKPTSAKLKYWEAMPNDFSFSQAVETGANLIGCCKVTVSRWLKDKTMFTKVGSGQYRKIYQDK